MIDPDMQVIVCMPWVQDSAMLAHALSLGVVKTECVGCGADVMISPASRKLRKEEGAEPVCLRCTEEIEAKASEIEYRVPKGVREEVRRNTGEEPEDIFAGLSSSEVVKKMREKTERWQNS